jgi:hypothetical protein
MSFTPQPLYRRRKSPRYSLDRRLVGPRTVLDDVDKRENLQDANIDLSVAQPVAKRYID